MTVDFPQETHLRERIARESLLVEHRRFAKEIALKKNIAEVERLLELLLCLNFFCKETNVLRQDFTQVFSLFGIRRDAEVDFDDVCHIDERLVARHQDEVVEGDLVARRLELLYDL